MKYLIKNKKYTLISLFFLCLSLHTKAQDVLVLNNSTQEPIAGTAIYNKNKSKSVVTDFYGKANLDIFNTEENIYFKHISFKLYVVKKALIENNKVLLISKSQGLDEIVISASKFKENKREVPKKIASVSASEIAFENPQTSADLLKSTGQVYIQKSQLGGGSPMIRGFSTNRLLITVDGVRMNNAIFRGGNIQNVISIDPFSIQSTEVSLGAGNVIYGSDAIGGVMSFYTKTPKVSFTDSTFIKTNAALRYATANQEKTAHLDINYGFKKWAFITNASYTDFGDLRMGSNGPEDYTRPEFVITNNNKDIIVENNNPNIQKTSGYNQFNIMQKARYEAKNNLSFDLGLFYTATSNTPRYDRLIRYRGENLRSAEWYYGPQKWFMSNLNVTKLSSKANLYDKIKATVAYQNFQESRIDRDFQSEFKNIREEAVDAISFNLDLEKKITNKTELFYGIEYVHNTINSVGSQENIITNINEPTVTRYPNGSTWQSAAVYTSLKYKPNTTLVFQTGLRYNNVTSKADFTENNTYLNLPFTTANNNSSALTGTAGISWNPNDLLQWKINFSSAFRAPNIDDIGKVFDSEPGSVVVPNNNLNPEYAYGGELGLALNFNNTFILDTATYYTYLDNALVRRDGELNGENEIFYDGELSNVQSIQNASKSWIYGFEVGAKINFSEKLKLTSQYNIIGGTEETDGIEVPVRHVSPSFGNTHFVWQNKTLKADIFLNYNDQLSFNQIAPSEQEKDYLYALDKNGNPYSPSWYTLNFRTQYQLNKETSITASLENITDQRYRPYSSGISAAGRNLIVALKYTL
ncbi:hemoglobin/transferrin/lactoferrin receptor protein [Lacinutrix venerupis]|uniref:TonB-dependent receptor plug domain-containing protein n=1 Tax=Lacinutrix venerupis TaxID=1486034 RepID=UPI000EB189FC|nr:TonB-dependent receptor [Lacinutrix venerupis]RLJ65494.1 hemoglobin/transferrin/lactoferrin receptor protein [Lacinutrix venerupis]